MQEKLKRQYRVQKEVSRGGYFQGIIDLSDLSRLPEYLCSDQAKISVEFTFCLSDFDTPMIEGCLQTSLTAECQRCLKPMQLPMQLDFKLLVCEADDKPIESNLDTVYSEEGLLDIFQVVEDELILGLPLVVTHADSACNEFWQAEKQESQPAARDNPFSVLEKLKTTH